MGSSICTSKPKNLVVIPIPTNQNNEDFSDDDEIVLKESSTENLTVLELFIKCTNLVAENRFQLLNTLAYVYIEENSQFTKKFETETQSSTLTPLFNKTLKISYNLGISLKIKIEIWEVSKKEGRLLGSSIINIHEIVTRSDILMKDLEVSGKRNGNLLVWAKELKHYSDLAAMQWEFDSKVFTKGLFLMRLVRTTSKQSIIYQSESKKPPASWEKFEVSVSRLCKGNMDKMIQIEVLSLESGLVVIGTAQFSLCQLKNNSDFEVPTFSNHVKNGLLKLVKFSYQSKPSFVELIRSGIEIHPFYIIDFSEKTGHSVEALDENPYLQCIKSIHSTLQFYTTDPLYTVLGTGCYFSNVQSPSYCFALNGNFFQPEVANHEILMDYYKTTVNNVTPANITKFGEIMETILKFIQHEGSEIQKYFVLFLISAGDPTDMREIHERLIILNQLPVSVFVLRVTNDLLTYDNLQSIKSPANRETFQFFEAGETQIVLEETQNQMMKFAVLKDFESIKKVENFRQRSNSIIKNLPEKIRSRSNYFTRVKSEYIEHLTKIGYSNDKIEEVTLIGVPFLVMSEHKNIRLPMRTRTKVMGLRTKSVKPVDLVCSSCSKAVFILAESKCGCKSFCYECVNTSECPICQKSL